MIDAEAYALRGCCEDQVLDAWQRISWICDHMPVEGICEVYSLVFPQSGDPELKRVSLSIDFGDLAERNLLKGVLRGMEIIELNRNEPDKGKRGTNFLVWVAQLN